jgi:hypothetical protein
MKDPIYREPSISVLLLQTQEYDRRTGPTRSGIKMDTNKTFTRINMKPSSVTILGASDNGSSLTKLFHYSALAQIQRRPACANYYIVPQYMVGNPRLIHAGVFVRLEVDESRIGKRIDCYG